MDPSTPQAKENLMTAPSQLDPGDAGDIIHPPRPPAEDRFYAITVGKSPGVYKGTDDWHAQINGIPGSAVRSFDTREVAEKAYQDAVSAGLVHRVEIHGERYTLMEDEVSSVPGMQAPDPSSGLLLQKWYAIYIGTNPGLYPGSFNVAPLISNVKGSRSARWGSYEQAYESFMRDLREGRVIQDTTQVVRTRIV